MIEVKAWYGGWHTVTAEQAIRFARKLIDGATGLKSEEKQSYIVSKHLRGVTAEELRHYCAYGGG